MLLFSIDGKGWRGAGGKGDHETGLNSGSFHYSRTYPLSSKGTREGMCESVGEDVPAIRDVFCVVVMGTATAAAVFRLG